MSKRTNQPPPRLPTHGGHALTHNAFAALSDMGLPSLQNPTPPEAKIPPSPAPPTPATQHRAPTSGLQVFRPSELSSPAPPKTRGRVDIIREKAGRGGKTVTIARGFVGIGLPEKESLAKQMRAACGTGGTVKDGRIEIQGDKRDQVARILADAGFRPIFAGG